MNTATNEVSSPLSPTSKALLAAEAAQDKKAFNPTIIDVDGRCSYADVILIASAANDRQTVAIADNIQDTLKREHGLRVHHREGSGGWVLLDFGDLLVHVFQEDSRAYYDIDQLWADAPRVRVPAPSRPETPDAGPSALARRKH